VPFALIGILTLLALASISVYLQLSKNGSSSSSTTSLNYRTTTNLSLGVSLELSVGVDQSGNRIEIYYQFVNIRQESSILIPANLWPINDSNFAPCRSYYPFSIALYSENATQETFSRTKPLYLYNPNNTYFCPQLFSVNYYVLTADTNYLTAYLFLSNTTIAENLPTFSHTSFQGYWVGPNSFTELTPGWYTVVLEDEWGDSLLSLVQYP
jgi:hypothetical protein